MSSPKTSHVLSKAHPEALEHYAIRHLEGASDEEMANLRSDIYDSCRVTPHIQQQIVEVEGGILRFRKNKIIEILLQGVESKGGMNYIAQLDVPDEDRAQFAQLIGYSVSGYQTLSYAMPLEEEVE